MDALPTMWRKTPLIPDLSVSQNYGPIMQVLRGIFKLLISNLGDPSRGVAVCWSEDLRLTKSRVREQFDAGRRHADPITEAPHDGCNSCWISLSSFAASAFDINRSTPLVGTNIKRTSNFFSWNPP
jgi:hypothetical protein